MRTTKNKKFQSKLDKDFFKSIMEETKERKKLWQEVKLAFPKLAKDIDFHMIDGKCAFGDSGCGWDD